MRSQHEIFLSVANDSLSNSVFESTQLLKSIGASPPQGGPWVPGQPQQKRKGSPTRSRRGSPEKLADLGSPRARSHSPAAAHLRGVTPASSRAPLQAGPLSPAHVLGFTSTDASLGRAQSARDLFAALSCAPGKPATLDVAGGGGGSSTSAAWMDPRNANYSAPIPNPRAIQVREFQRGTAVVQPAPPLPFPGPNALSPGQRKQQQNLHIAAGHQPVPVRGKTKPALADGTTTMLAGVYGDLGEIITAPASTLSSFDLLLDRLVDTPESCFVPLASLPRAPIVIAGRARGATPNPKKGLHIFRS